MNRVWANDQEGQYYSSQELDDRNWACVVITWTDIERGIYPIRAILDWVDTTPGGNYALTGYGVMEGFNFHFEDQQDAVHFILRWM